MNHKAMLELADRLEREMPRVDMETTIYRASCGSIGCIGGWWSEWNCNAMGFVPAGRSHNFMRADGHEITAMSLAAIGLDLDDDQRECLFHFMNWPEDLTSAYCDTLGPQETSEENNKKRVRLMAERIRRMVKEDIARAGV